MNEQTLRLLEDPEGFVSRVAERAARVALDGNGSLQPRDWLTEKELAELWGCSQDTIRSYAFRAEHPLPYGAVGEIRRYHRADFDAWAREEGERDRQRRLDAKKQGEKQGRLQEARPTH